MLELPIVWDCLEQYFYSMSGRIQNSVIDCEYMYEGNKNKLFISYNDPTNRVITKYGFNTVLIRRQYWELGYSR